MLSPPTLGHDDQNRMGVFLTSRENSWGALTFYTQLSSDSHLGTKTRVLDMVTETLAGRNVVPQLLRTLLGHGHISLSPALQTEALPLRIKQERRAGAPQDPMPELGTWKVALVPR